MNRWQWGDWGQGLWGHGRPVARMCIQVYHYLPGIDYWMDMSLSKLAGLVLDRDTWHAAVQVLTKSRT